MGLRRAFMSNVNMSGIVDSTSVAFIYHCSARFVIKLNYFYYYYFPSKSIHEQGHVLVGWLHSTNNDTRWTETTRLRQK